MSLVNVDNLKMILTDMKNKLNNMINNHTNNTSIHITEEERTTWNSSNISKMYCKNNNLYIKSKDGTIKQIENFSLSKAINEQVDYCQLGFNNTITQISTTETLIPFTTCNGNMSLNDDGTITLKANKTYKLSFYFRITDTDTLKALTIKQNGTFLFNAIAKASEDTETCTSIYIFTPTKNTNIGIYTPTYDNQIPTLTSTTFYSNTKLIIEEIAQPVVNNINCSVGDISNNDKNLEDTPIGHVISFMGTSAPEHYLICDGTEYNITDYRELADFINTQFGSYNYFGGDGTTTFAVPDLSNNISTEDLWSVPDGYAYEGTGVISTIRGRTYNKKNEGKAIVANVNSTTDNATYCYLISTNQNYIIGSCSYDSSELGTVNASFDYKGFTWYISVIPYGFNTIETISSEYKTFTIDCNQTDYETIGLSVLQQIEITKIANSQQYIKYEHTYYANIVNTITETILYTNENPLTNYAIVDTPLELTFNEDLTQYDKIEIFLADITYKETDTWSPYVAKIEGKGNENIYYRNCLWVSNTSYCSVQLNYYYSDKKIKLYNFGMSTSDIKGATILKVIGTKY